MAKYVNLDDVIEHLELHWGYEGLREDLYALPTADVAQVRRGRWKYYHKQGVATCIECSFERHLCSKEHENGAYRHHTPLKGI